jgi:hypothetical protein
VGQRIEAGPVIDIYEVHPYGFVADKRFAMTGHPRIVFLETQDFGSPNRMYHNSFRHYSPFLKLQVCVVTSFFTAEDAGQHPPQPPSKENFNH